jgi:hypothetical protein
MKRFTEMRSTGGSECTEKNDFHYHLYTIGKIQLPAVPKVRYQLAASIRWWFNAPSQLPIPINTTDIVGTEQKLNVSASSCAALSDASKHHSP